MINEIVDYEYDPKSISNRPGYSNIVNNKHFSKGSSDQNSSNLVQEEESQNNEESKNDFAIEKQTKRMDFESVKLAENLEKGLQTQEELKLDDEIPDVVI